MDPNKIIDAFGGVTKVAELCEITPQAVWQWRADGIPKARILYLRALRPELFADRRKQNDQVNA